MVTSALRPLCSPVPLPGVTRACRWGSSLRIASMSYCASPETSLFQVDWPPLLLGFLAWVFGGTRGGCVSHFSGSAPFQRPLQGAACIAAISPLGRDPGVAEAQLAPPPLWWLGLRLCPCPATAPCPLLAALRPAFSPCDCIFIWVCLNHFLQFHELPNQSSNILTSVLPALC